MSAMYATYSWEEFEQTCDLILRWLRARPFLRISQSAYSRKLVQHLIDILESWQHESGTQKYVEAISALRKAFDDPPPPRHTPPPRVFSKGGGLFLWLA